MPVEGIYEREGGSGFWCASLKINGKLVRKSSGRNRAAAANYVEKARTLRRSGEGTVPVIANCPVLTIPELEVLGGSVTINDLCDDYLEHVQGRPDLFKDPRNTPHRLDLIRQAFGSRAAASVRTWEIEDWLTGVHRRSTRGDGRLTKKAPLKPGTLNRLKAYFSVIYQHGKLRDKVQVNPARDAKQRRMNKGVIRWLKPDEEERLRAALFSHIETKAHLAQYQEPLVRHRLCELDLALGTGMRRVSSTASSGLMWILTSASSPCGIPRTARAVLFT